MRDDAASTDSERWDAPGTPEPREATQASAQAATAQVDGSAGLPSRIPDSIERFAPALALATVAAIVLAGLSSFGIWDPWEIAVAEKARRLAEGELEVGRIGPWLVGLGFRLFGVEEWSGRLPIALSGVAAAALAYPLVARFAGRRAGAYAVLVAGTSPLLLFNARTMLGEAPVFALQAGTVASAMLALFGTRASAHADGEVKTERGGAMARVGFLLLALALACGAALARGALLGALPALLAVALTAAFEGKLRARRADPIGFASAIALGGGALGLLVIVSQAVIADRAGFSVVLGGTPQGGQPPTFEVAIERAFHAFAPWSALLPLALSRLVMAGGAARLSPAPEVATTGSADPGADGGDRPLRIVCLLWLALSYAALTLFMSRYGNEAAVFPLVAMAAAVALFLRDVEQARASLWPAAIATALLALLVLRDYSLYPSGPMHGMPLADFTVPEVFNPKRIWAALLVTFGAVTLLGLGAYEQGASTLREQLTAPYRLIAAQWRKGPGFKTWLLLFAAVLLALEVFGVVSWVAPKAAHLSTQAVKWGRRLVFVPAALPLSVAAAQVLVHFFAKLRELRCLPILAAGVGVALYSAFGFMPALSSHFSPREVYETYNALAADGEPLLEYKVATRAARYYAKGETRDVDRMPELIDALVESERMWVVLAAEELAPVDRAFRAKTGRHLFVADARSANMTLATNQPIAGRRDQSFLGEFVKREPPANIQHRVDANFDDKILLLGYDLKLPHGDHVAAGETFELTWYFKALRPVPGAYRLFVHIDANSMRIHGDHDPVDGRYPVRMWDEGDVIVDRQRIDVPPNYSAGAYTIFMGFYSGETRLVVKEGPRDDANRVRAGVLRIR